jgi:chromosome segregation ATPase
MSDTAKSIRQNKETAIQELAAFDTQEGKQLNKLEQISKDTANAWKWVQANRDKFEHEVYGPPMISCSVKDGRYTNVLESFLKKNDFLAITAQSLADMKKLSNQFYKVMKLGEVTVRTSEEPLPQDPPILSRQQMQQFGLDGWALEFIDGPEPVLAMLNGSGRLQRSAVAMQDNSEAQYDMIIEDGSLVSWAAGKQLYQISRRREYGPDAQTTITKSVNAAKYWTDQPVDTSASREIQQRIDELDAEFNELKQQVLPIREERDEKISKRKEIEGEIVSHTIHALGLLLTDSPQVDMKNKKADLQKAKNEQESLPGRIGKHILITPFEGLY